MEVGLVPHSEGQAGPSSRSAVRPGPQVPGQSKGCCLLSSCGVSGWCPTKHSAQEAVNKHASNQGRHNKQVHKGRVNRCSSKCPLSHPQWPPCVPEALHCHPRISHGCLMSHRNSITCQQSQPHPNTRSPLPNSERMLPTTVQLSPKAKAPPSKSPLFPQKPQKGHLDQLPKYFWSVHRAQLWNRNPRAPLKSHIHLFAGTTSPQRVQDNPDSPKGTP